jgi:hypothetical protein
VAKAAEDPPSPVDAYEASATATPVGEVPATASSPSGYYGVAGTPVVQITQPKSKPFDDWTVLAIAALFASCIGLTIPGVVMGHLALHKIKQTGQAGRGLAIAALIVGYVLTVVILLAVAAWVIFLIWTASVANSATDLGTDFG